jgi:alpha-1,2-mannosyltransferase
MAVAPGERIRPATDQPVQQTPGGRRGLFACAAVFAILLAAYLADVLAHRMLNWFDLSVYVDAGKIARHDPGRLYSFSVNSRGFTYPPFAAMVFAVLAGLPWTALEPSVTALSLVSVMVTAWVTFGALHWRGARRLAATLALAGVALWLEPVQRALQYGQAEPLLMLLAGWDLCQPDSRRLKGLGIGIAAGIKLVPLIFIPYLLLAGKIRQAIVAGAVFMATIGLGWLFLPGTFGSYWLSGTFLHPDGIGLVGGLRNQSIDGLLIRIMGSASGAGPAWIVIAIVAGLSGILAAAALNRCGQPVAGWVTCALTGLLISPVSWDHHWVWLVPLLAVLTGRAVRGRGFARLAWWAAIGATVLLFAAYPHTLHGSHAYVPMGGLLGAVNDFPVVRPALALHPALLLTRNIFVLGGVILFAALLIAAWRARGPAKPAPR